MTQLPEGKSRLDMVKSGHIPSVPKRGRFVVSIERLLEDPHNERKTFRNMDDLIESVRRHGIIEPITVTPDGENYRIVTGHRRFRAAKAVCLSEIEVLVREPDDKSTRRFKSLVSNIQRENIGAVELAETLQVLLEEEAVPTQRELARQIGKTEHWVSAMLRILTLPPKLQEQLRGPASSIGYDTAQKIARVEDPVLQEDLIFAALAGESNRAIRHRIETAKPLTPRVRKQGRGSVILFTEKVENCIATVKAKPGKGVRDAMMKALRLLEKQVRDDDTIQ
jgi:ParB/RepB/Spo0J family partition protein